MILYRIINPVTFQPAYFLNLRGARISAKAVANATTQPCRIASGWVTDDQIAAALNCAVLGKALSFTLASSETVYPDASLEVAS